MLNEKFVNHLPLPLAQLYVRAENAKTPQERHFAGYYLWEATVKLVAIGAIVDSAHRFADEDLAECFQCLAKPSMGHWWGLTKKLVDLLSAAGLDEYELVKELAIRERDDLPHAAGLESAICKVVPPPKNEHQPNGSTVRVSRLFDRLVQYRNREVAHGAIGARDDAHHDRMARAFLRGMENILSILDFLQKRRLVYVSDVRRSTSGAWVIERLDLSGTTVRRMGNLEFPAEHGNQLPRIDTVYLTPSGEYQINLRHFADARMLNSLIEYDAVENKAYFLNARRGKSTAEMLCYTTGDDKRELLSTKHTDLLTRLLGAKVSPSEIEQWSQSDDGFERDDAEEVRHTLGGYELISVLGTGGMGKVYRARQPSLGRQVALKRLLSSGNEKAEARFSREIRVLGRVDHRNLVRIFDSGSEGDESYYVMELIDGTDLAHIWGLLAEKTTALEADETQWHDAVTTACDEFRKSEKRISDASGIGESLPTDHQVRPIGAAKLDSLASTANRSYLVNVVELIKQVADALHALHEAGIVHRDVKPSNIMITSEGRPVLMDLGLAQVLDEHTIAQTRQFVGTLRYASPEQVLAADRVDRRSDIYSLGATLCELLTLEPLYGVTDRASSPDLMRIIQYQEPKRPSKINHRIPRDLDAIVLKCLQKNPDGRYRSAASFSEDLQRWLDGVPVNAQPPTMAYLLTKTCRRHWKPLVVAASVLMVIVSTAIFSAVSIANKNRELKSTNVELDRALHAAEDSERVARERERHALTVGYVADMRLADSMLRESNFWTARQLLQRYRDEPVKQSLRGWEWAFLNGMCDDGSQTIARHKDVVRALSISNDRSLLAAAGYDGLVTLCDPRGNFSKRIALPNSTLFAVDVNPDVSLVAIGGRISHGKSIGVVFVCDVDSGTVQQQFGHEQTVTSVKFLDQGRALAACDGSGVVRFWSVTDGSELGQWDKGHRGRLHDLVHFSGQLASGGEHGEVLIRRRDDQTEVARLQLDHNVLLSMSYSPSGRLLVAGGGDHDLPPIAKVWETGSWEEVAALAQLPSRVYAVGFSADESQLAAGCANGDVLIYDTTTWEPLGRIRAHQSRVTGLAFSSKDVLLTAGADHLVKRWVLISGPDGQIATTHDERGFSRMMSDSIAITELVIDEPNDRIVMAQGNNVKWVSANGKDSGTLHAGQTRQLAVAVDPVSSRIALATPTSNGQSQVTLMNSSGELEGSFGTHRGRVQELEFSPDGKWLASGGDDAVIRLWNAQSGALISEIELNDRATAIAFSPTSGFLACSGHGGKVILWDLNTQTKTSEFQSVRMITDLVFDPRGEQLCASSMDREVRVHRLATGDKLSLRGHRDMVTSVGWSGDGKTIFTASADGAVVFWNAESGHLLFEISPNVSAPCLCVRMARDGRFVCVATAAGELRLWRPGATD